MNLAYWRVLIAGVMPVFTVAIAKLQRGYGDSNPRAWLDRQQGMHRRADYAHRHHFGVLPFIAAAAILARQLHASKTLIDALAVTFIVALVARIASTLFYLTGRPHLRTAAFTVGYGCMPGLFFPAAYRNPDLTFIHGT